MVDLYEKGGNNYMKNKIILLVSMLLPLVSSCGENPTIEPTPVPTDNPTVEPTIEPTIEPTAEPTIEPTQEIINNYKESEYSKVLNTLRCSSNFVGEPGYEYSYIDSYIYSKSHSLIQYSGDKNQSYYLCAYIHKDDLKFMNEYISNNKNPIIHSLMSEVSYPTTDFNYLCGFDGSFLMFNHFRNDKNVNKNYPDYKFKDVLWYEMSTKFSMPMSLGDYQLSLIAEEYYFDFYDLDKNYLGTKSYLLECREHRLYNKLNVFSQYMMNQYEAALNIINNQSLYVVPFSYSSNYDFIDSLIHPPYSYEISGIKVENINDVDYVCIYDENLDRIKKNKEYEVIEKNDIQNYLKLEDLIDYLKSIVYK